MVGIAKLQYSTLNRYDSEAREFTSVYLIEDVDPLEGPVTIGLASGLPALGDSYFSGSEWDTYCVAVGYSNFAPVSYPDMRNVWTANVHYSTNPAKQRRPADNHDNPIDKPPQISGRGHRRRGLAHDIRPEDTQGRKVLNTAESAFPAAEVTVDDGNNSMRITKNYASINLNTLDEYKDAVNSGVFMGRAARTWKMEPAEWQLIYGAVTYYAVTYEFQNNPETWDLKPLNSGETDINGAGPKREGVNLQGHSTLDFVGLFFTAIPGFPPIRFNGQGGNPNAFRWYKEKDFTQLGLPSTLPS